MIYAKLPRCLETQGKAWGGQNSNIVAYGKASAISRVIIKYVFLNVRALLQSNFAAD